MPVTPATQDLPLPGPPRLRTGVDANRRRFIASAAASGFALLQHPATWSQERQPASAAATPLSRLLANHAAGFRYESLAQDVVLLAKRAILDTLASAYSGYSAKLSRVAQDLARQSAATPPATVLISGLQTSAEMATFANGVMIRYLDFNDSYVSHTGGAGHPSDMLAALLVAAEQKQRSGRDLIAATVLAYEAFGKVADVFDYLGNGIDHTTMTGIGATVGIGWLAGLTVEQMVNSIGIQVGGNTATRQGRSDELSNWKAFAAADACRKAMFSVRLAQAGMTGPPQVFEGSYGFFRVMGRKPVDPVQLGEPFAIRRAFMKRFPVGQFAQTVVEAALAVRDGIGDVEDIREVNLHVSRSAIRIMADSPDKWAPRTHETADHSIPYAAALALMHGRIKAEYYDSPHLEDAGLLRLTGKVKCLPSEEAERLKLATLCELELVMRSGERRRSRVEHHRGHYRNPMTNAEIEEKCRLVATPFMTNGRLDELLGKTWDLEKLTQAAILVETTRV